MDAGKINFRPPHKVLARLRQVRSQGVAKYLGTIDADLVERIRKGCALTEGHANHDYIDDVTVHWARAGHKVTDADKNTSYTNSLKNNVVIAKLSDEDGQTLSRYKNSSLADAIEEWRNIISKYADDLTLTRVNILRGGGNILEHIDPPDQNMIQCLLSGDTSFVFRTKAGKKEYQMKVGEIWWFNTTWPHSTYTLSHEERFLLHTRGTIKPHLLKGTSSEKTTV